VPGQLQTTWPDQKEVIEMTNAETTPIACKLTPDDYKARLAWIAGLTRDALRGHLRRDLELELVYAADAAERVLEMVSKERDCCAFLTFAVDERPGEIRLTIRAPEHARDAADMLLGQFLPSAEVRDGCTCC
jgi:hypothetical protein